MLKTEVVEFQEVMNDLLNPYTNDDKKPSYYILNFKDKTIIPVSGVNIRALKAFGKDRYSVFIKRYKDRKDETDALASEDPLDKALFAVEEP